MKILVHIFSYEINTQNYWFTASNSNNKGCEKSEPDV